MNIVLVSQEYPPETAHGGIATQTHLKAHGLAALGHRVVVVSRSTDGRRRERADGQVRVIRIPGMDDRLPLYTEPARWVTYSTQVAAVVAELHTEDRIDLVDFPEWGCEGYVHLLNQTEWNRIPSVLHLHGPLPMLAHTLGWPDPGSELYQVGTGMERSCLRRADAVFSSSACTADWCARHYGLERSRIPVLHMGVDTRRFRPLAVPKHPSPTIVFVGRIARAKGAEVLVRAALALAPDHPGLRVRMLGRDEERLGERLLATARAAGFPGLLELAGPASRAMLPMELSRATVFAAPSLYEGGPGLVYLEAMACGLPVVGCEAGGVSEVVTGEDGGLLVPPNDVDALIKALDLLLREPDLRAAMGRRARARVVAEADSRACVRRLASLYAAVVEGRP